MKNTEERIEEILKDLEKWGIGIEISADVLKLQLEALVIQAQLEQIKQDYEKIKAN